MNEDNKQPRDDQKKDQENKVEIKKIERDTVRQSFSHGRSKSVEVEVKKRRTVAADRRYSKERSNSTSGGLTLSELAASKNMTRGELENRLNAVRNAVEDTQRREKEKAEQNLLKAQAIEEEKKQEQEREQERLKCEEDAKELLRNTPVAPEPIETIESEEENIISSHTQDLPPQEERGDEVVPFFPLEKERTIRENRVEKKKSSDPLIPTQPVVISAYATVKPPVERPERIDFRDFKITPSQRKEDPYTPPSQQDSVDKKDRPPREKIEFTLPPSRNKPAPFQKEAGGGDYSRNDGGGAMRGGFARPSFDRAGGSQDRSFPKSPVPIVPIDDFLIDSKNEKGPGRPVKKEVSKTVEAAKTDPKKAAVKKAAQETVPRRLTGHLLTRALDGEGDLASKSRSIASLKRARQKQKHKGENTEETSRVVREVVIPETILVGELANRMAVRGADVVKSLMRQGMMVTINQALDADTAELLCSEFGHTVKRVSDLDIEKELLSFSPIDEISVPRPPVVTVMGHVDHGKTSLLDALRETDVVAEEAGGITQHIGAYQVTLKSMDKITFIDTPGHAAFTEMRARGAHVTDVVVLVVAADDGVMEQTIEAIHHAQAAKVPVIVAINKIDKPNADSARVRSELLSHGIVIEDFGGDVMTVDVSAKKRLNLDKLEEIILLQAEVLDLKACVKRPAFGAVIESRVDKGRGVVATVLVQTGTLRVGDVFVAGSQFGKVRALVNDHGRKISEALPSMPVEVLGFDGSPIAGDEFIVVESEQKAREVCERRILREREKRNLAMVRSSMEQMMHKIASGEMKELAVVVKADVHGSLEAIMASLSKVGTEEVSVRILHGGVGGINESDMTLARASNALVIGFNVRANVQARDIARRDSIDIRYYSIIYNVIDDVKSLLSGLLSPTIREKYLGVAEIRTIFSVPRVGKVAGCLVTDGLIKRGAKVRLLRDNVVIHEGELKTLKRFKDEVKEVKETYECGLSLDNYQDIKENDVIECFEMEEIERTL